MPSRFTRLLEYSHRSKSIVCLRLAILAFVSARICDDDVPPAAAVRQTIIDYHSCNRIIKNIQ